MDLEIRSKKVLKFSCAVMASVIIATILQQTVHYFIAIFQYAAIRKTLGYELDLPEFTLTCKTEPRCNE